MVMQADSAIKERLERAPGRLLSTLTHEARRSDPTQIKQARSTTARGSSNKSSKLDHNDEVPSCR